MLSEIKRKLKPTPHGQSLVEMAFITPLLLLMFIGVLEVGWAIRGYIVLLNADREGTRFAARGQYLDFPFATPSAKTSGTGMYSRTPWTACPSSWPTTWCPRSQTGP
jgi:Flp pilus assembly protein TadG